MREASVSRYLWPRTGLETVAYQGGFGGSNPSPPKFRSFDKAEPNSQFHGKYIRNLIRVLVSLIFKLSGTPDKGATRTPFSLPSFLNWICWTPPPPPSEQNSWVRHWLETGAVVCAQHYGGGILVGRWHVSLKHAEYIRWAHINVFSEFADVFHSSDGEPFTVFCVQWTVNRPLLPPAVLILCDMNCHDFGSLALYLDG
jgi:hypothetical protein